MRFLEQADVGNRTRDLILTMDALYQLSYVGLVLGILATVALLGERADTPLERERRQLYEPIRSYPAQLVALLLPCWGW
jgi:hypothetical protein